MFKNKTYKMFFVEIDDDDRERVVSCLVEHITINGDREHILCDMSPMPVATLVTDYRLTAGLVQHPDGTMFKIEDFSQEEDEDE